jgi:hypothetical protein
VKYDLVNLMFCWPCIIVTSLHNKHNQIDAQFIFTYTLLRFNIYMFWALLSSGGTTWMQIWWILCAVVDVYWSQDVGRLQSVVLPTAAHRPRKHTLYDITPIQSVFQVTQTDPRSYLMMADYCRNMQEPVYRIKEWYKSVHSVGYLYYV